MKRGLLLFTLLLICIIVLTVEPATASEDSNLQLTQKQINKLISYGMPEDEIPTLTKEKLTAFMREISKPPVEKVTSAPQEYTKEERDFYYQVMKEKNLDSKSMEMLGNLGYDFEDIHSMSEKEINRILTHYKAYDQGGAKAVNPWPYAIPYFGSSAGETTYFDTQVYLSASAISGYCEDAMDFAEYVFNRTYNYASTKAGQNIRFSYFLYGEQSPGIHEGMDVVDVNSSERLIRTATPGEIVFFGGSFGQVRVYADYITETICYLHMKNIPRGILNGTIQEVALGDTIGYQSNAGITGANHLHVQALDGRYDASTIPSGTNTVLESRIPYWYITFYI